MQNPKKTSPAIKPDPKDVINPLFTALQPLTHLFLEDLYQRASTDDRFRAALAEIGQQMVRFAESIAERTGPTEAAQPGAELLEQALAMAAATPCPKTAFAAGSAAEVRSLEIHALLSSAPNGLAEPQLNQPEKAVDGAKNGGVNKSTKSSPNPLSNDSNTPADSARADSAGAANPVDEGNSESEHTWVSNWSSPVSQISRADLVWIRARCRMKAEAARWAAERIRRIEQRADVEIEITPLDRDLLRRAGKLPECFVWTHKLSLSNVGKPADYDRLAGNFDASAEALEFVEFMLDREGEDDVDLSRALYLMAETQSALRASVQFFAPDWKYDNDQILIFQWLRQIGRERNIFISQYMRLDDMADPDAWEARIERIHDMQAEVLELEQEALAEQRAAEERERNERQQAEQRAKRTQELFGAIKYHAKSIQRNAGAASVDPSHDWRRIIAAASELVTMGTPPSNVDLRTALLPLIDLMPVALETSREFDLILREVDAYLALQEQDDAQGNAATGNAANAAHEGAGDVAKVAEMLRGRALVLIGGDRRPHTAEALKKAFGLSELIWIATRSHQSYTVFEPDVARPDVAAVILAIRWASHGFGEVKSVCDKYGKPLVRLPAGYNPNQVAAQLLSQAGERLALVNS